MMHTLKITTNLTLSAQLVDCKEDTQEVSPDDIYFISVIIYRDLNSKHPDGNQPTPIFEIQIQTTSFFRDFLTAKKKEFIQLDDLNLKIRNAQTSTNPIKFIEGNLINLKAEHLRIYENLPDENVLASEENFFVFSMLVEHDSSNVGNIISNIREELSALFIKGTDTFFSADFPTIHAPKLSELAYKNKEELISPIKEAILKGFDTEDNPGWINDVDDKLSLMEITLGQEQKPGSVPDKADWYSDLMFEQPETNEIYKLFPLTIKGDGGIYEVNFLLSGSIETLPVQ